MSPSYTDWNRRCITHKHVAREVMNFCGKLGNYLNRTPSRPRYEKNPHIVGLPDLKNVQYVLPSPGTLIPAKTTQGKLLSYSAQCDGDYSPGEKAVFKSQYDVTLLPKDVNPRLSEKEVAALGVGSGGMARGGVGNAPAVVRAGPVVPAQQRPSC